MQDVIFTSLSTPDVRKIIQEELGNFFNHYKLKSSAPAAEDDILTIDDAALFIGLSKHRIYFLCSKRLVPHAKRGKRLYFSKKELTAWIRKGKRETVSEVESSTGDIVQNKS